MARVIGRSARTGGASSDLAERRGGAGTVSSTGEAAERRVRNLKEIRELSYLLDNSFRIPIINYRFGIDPILGLVPVIGDFSALGISAYIIFRAARLGAPMPLILMMTVNAVGDTVVGSVPVLGTLVDFVWKANSRNLRMLERFLDDERRR